MSRNAALSAVLVAAALLAGCVERRYVITSDPPGAAVYRNGQFLGATPVDDQFVYYGKYRFTLVRQGFETLQVEEPINAPYYEYPPGDFVSENLIPYTFQDVRRFHYALQPLQTPSSDKVLQDGETLRGRGKLLAPLPPHAPAEAGRGWFARRNPLTAAPDAPPPPDKP